MSEVTGERQAHDPLSASQGFRDKCGQETASQMFNPELTSGGFGEHFFRIKIVMQD